MRRFGLLYIASTFFVLGIGLWPLVTGQRTLYLRDVLTSHLPLKAAQAESLRRGELPSLIDPYRAGGQPLLGNPNVLPLYPDNLLYTVSSDLAGTLWALNAHFWLHLLLAPCAFYWLGRAWGLRREAAWAGGVFYAASGFVLSLMNLYNLIAGAAIAPAFVAACLDAAKPKRPWPFLAAALLLALLLLAGDPLFALLAVVAAGTAVLVRDRALPRRPLTLAAALAGGAALAAPMLVEFLRILPLSLRGYRSYSATSALLQSWDPRTAMEWLLPLFFGTPDLGFWGQRFYGDLPPLFYSSYPGILVLGLLALAGPWRRRAVQWSWILIGLGLFLALGKWNPVMHALYRLPGASALRYPVKVWLLVALGTALLAALGFERLVEGGARRPFRRVLGVGVLIFLGLWLFFAFSAVGGPALAPQRLRWAGLCLLSLGVLALLGMAFYLMKRRPALGGALLLSIHLVAQLFFLGPLIDSDEIGPYLEPPELLASLPSGSRVVHGGVKDLFGPQRLSLTSLPFPDLRTHWLARVHFAQLYPFSGIPRGLRYELNPSPEGLDSFLTFSLTQALARLSDPARLRILAASGVDVLLLDRPLEAPALSQVRLLARQPTVLGDVHAYELLAAAPSVQLVDRIHRAPQMNAAVAILTDPSFDARAAVVLPGEGASLTGRVEAGRVEAGRVDLGRAEITRESADEIEVLVDATSAAVLVVQRTYHEIYRATVDGEPASIEPANLHRLAVRVPAGEHRVVIRADRAPTRLAWGLAALGLLGLVLLSRSRFHP